MPKVSICVPTYNNPEEVSRLLASVKEQVYTDYEVILTDDSRDDRIEELTKRLTKQEPEFGCRLRYFHNSTQLGHIFNWNEAISHAEGEYIKIMFSDDWFTGSDSLKKMTEALDANPRAAMVFSGNLQVSEQNTYARKPDPGYVEKLREDYRYLFVSNQVGAPSNTMYRAAEGIAFDEHSNWASDVFLYMEILGRNPQFVFLEEPLISIGIHENQYTESFASKDPRIFGDYRYMFEKYGLAKVPMLREYFLTRYLVRYKNGSKEAVSCGYGRKEFHKARAAYYRKEVLPCYLNAIKRRIGR